MMRANALAKAVSGLFAAGMLIASVGCSSKDTTHTTKDTTHTMHLTVTSALSGSQQLVVEDGSGTTVAAETVTLPEDCLWNGCTSVVDVPGVPEEDFYKLVLGSGIPKTATLQLATLQANNWSASVQL